MADKETVRKEYETGKYTFKQLADKFNISQGTIKSWAKRDKDNGQPWKKVATKTKNQNKKVATEKEVAVEEKEPVFEEVQEVLNNPELTDKQRLFCVIYAKRQNATKAYQKVYKCTYETAMICGNRLLRNVKVKEQINKLLEAELNKEFLKRGLIQQYKDIAFSDIGDYLEFGKKKVPQWTKDKDGKYIPVIDPNTGEQKINEYSYVDLKDSVDLDTSIITEVSEGKDGIKFKLADKMKAMEILSKLSNLLSDEEKTKLELEYKKLQGEKLRVEIEKVKNPDKDKQNALADAVLKKMSKRNDTENG
ncbi:DUF1804 family protein [Clostridium sp. BJN0013]|uniref:DUF1804 family protein n=1 Tax=Clostridium sp. BJN0013 TaxID=3236840 RepID=UPI0034C6605E